MSNHVQKMGRGFFVHLDNPTVEHPLRSFDKLQDANDYLRAVEQAENAEHLNMQHFGDLLDAAQEVLTVVGEWDDGWQYKIGSDFVEALAGLRRCVNEAKR